MDREGFRQLLREREVAEDQIEQQIALAERFEAFASEPPTPDDARAFSAILVGLPAAGHVVTQALPVAIKAYDTELPAG